MTVLISSGLHFNGKENDRRIKASCDHLIKYNLRYLMFLKKNYPVYDMYWSVGR
jgi:hypothetical protein